ncbi:MAG: phosphatase PAP2 family protein [Pirellulaceae bacterium]
MRSRPYLLAAFFAVAACASLTIDMPVARRSPDSWALGDVRKMLDISEVFAHGFGVLLILITAAVLDPRSRARLPRVAACAFGAGGLAQVLKHLFPRIRPNAVDTSGDVLSTFLTWGAGSQEQAVELSRRAVQSFPSGHAATAVGLAFGLGWLYPRGRWLFVFFAVLAAAQRVGASAHFVSDTLAAAAVGSLVAGLCLRQRGAGRWFTRYEQTHEQAAAEHAELFCARMTVEVKQRNERAA